MGSIRGQQGGEFPPSMDEEHLQQPLPSSRKLCLQRTHEKVTAGTPSTVEVLYKHRQKLQRGEPQGNRVGWGLLFGSHPFPADRVGRGWDGGPLQQQQGQGGLKPFAGLSKQEQSGGGIVGGGQTGSLRVAQPGESHCAMSIDSASGGEALNEETEAPAIQWYQPY
uniref:Uncharacterized protein n=1 Tax=Chromera velia CCMP2878 TaxID=1169474 RepID=A0A0G4HCJ1_9ALVE|eukprot:Cvel_6290.t1-p1 / transcript=Cvel_6290.t1 / gene=Cvel_6290 / organism=Chromera_velia_CCMP2878 / gene_product=hypothetical protein / transcript_product=hypothetical protein / location=Cvel_scaffold305:53114-53608(-) / protein_length=165 / sequence_SO=supercontig / SO=protein_coding / is_pseudo=false